MILRKALLVALAAIIIMITVLSANLSQVLGMSQDVIIWGDMVLAAILFIVIVMQIRKNGWASRRNQ
ncbi:hypothetical protein [Paenibacillus pini]|uniref:Uncharacterized protein n=1 Tax=Paenibacillus pini JCM 16418 TaxID=1236976 RepID=W7Z7K3_9BACL|nr:hypothetical protein [Paenibacillus pini]GAF10364.1 hypothetical protein JCM16418_4550 [Paenibacillus pini JCM 16418]